MACWSIIDLAAGSKGDSLQNSIKGAYERKTTSTGRNMILSIDNVHNWLILIIISKDMNGKDLKYQDLMWKLPI